MVKEIRIYIGRDRGSLELFRTINEILRSLPPGERPRLKVKTFKIKNPAEFKAFVKQLEELFGGMYTVEIRKYGIESIPAIIVDGEKVLEGKYPTPEELKEIILGAEALLEAPVPQEPLQPPSGGAGVEMEKPSPGSGEETPLPPVKPVAVEEVQPPQPVEFKEEALPQPEERHIVSETPQQTVEKPLPKPPAPPSLAEAPGEVERGVIVEPEEFKLDEEPLPPPSTKTQPPPKPAPPAPVYRSVVPKKAVLPPTAPRPRPKPPLPPPAARQPPSINVQPSQPPAEPRTGKPVGSEETRQPAGEKVDLSKTCLTCIFYSKERKRCTLYHIPIEDPYHPPPICERVKR